MQWKPLFKIPVYAPAIGFQTWMPGLIDGKKVIAKKDRRKGLINVVKESKMFEDHYETSN